MPFKTPTKLTTVLLASTVLAGTMILPETVHGTQKARLEAIERKKQEALAQQRLALGGAHGAVLTAHEKQAAALADPVHAVNVTLLAALDAATNDAGTAAHTGHNTANMAERITALHALEGAIAAGGGAHVNDRNTHIPAVKTALGIKDMPAPDATKFLKRLIAFADPAAALAIPAAPGNLPQALIDAVAVNPSAAHAHAGHVATDAGKIAALKAIEGNTLDANDDVAKGHIRTALGLDPNLGAANHAAITATVAAFIKAAEGAHSESLIDGIKTKLVSGTVVQVRQLAHGGGGNMVARVFPTPPTQARILQELADTMWDTIQENNGNGHLTTKAEINKWLDTQFGIK